MKVEVHAMPDNNRSRMVPCRAIGSVILFLLIWLVVNNTPCAAGAPLVGWSEVTDVTPGSFAVSWQSSEPASGALYLFKGDCVTPVSNPLLSSEGSDRSGIIKVTVAELSANTAYCYQTVTTSKSTSETSVYPALPVLVLTEKTINRDMVVGGKSVPFANDLLHIPAPYLPASTDSQDGLLIVLKLLDGKGDKPLSLLLTTDDTKNYFNMNNLFDPTGGQSVNLTGGERVRITERHGNLGCTAIDRFRNVPADMETTRGNSFDRCARSNDIDCNSKVNILDILRVAHGIGNVNGDTCFNSDLDINADGKVDQMDMDAVTGGFDATP
jgi:hypothetical protein